MTPLILLLAVIAFLIALPVCGVVMRSSRAVGWVDAAGSEAHKPLLPGTRVGEGGVPNTGGAGVFVAVAWPMVAVLLSVWVVPTGWWDRYLPAVAGHLEGLRRTSAIGGGLLAGLATVHVLGLYDDRRALPALPKLLVQLAVALALVVWCDMRVLHLLSGYGPIGVVLSYTASVVWITVIVNAMNFLDNMDGLAAGVGLIIAGLYLAATLISGQWFVAALAALLVGALAGFLVYNLPPARLYLGDGGSLVLGLMLACISIRTTYFDATPAPGSVVAAAGVNPPAPGSGTASGGWYGLLMPLLIMAVPLYDFASVTVIRVLTGHSPFRGDHNHFSHRLQRLGLSKRGVLAVVYLATGATSLGGVMLGRLSGWQAVLVAAQTACVLLMLAVLEYGAAGRAAKRDSATRER